MVIPVRLNTASTLLMTSIYMYIARTANQIHNVISSFFRQDTHKPAPAKLRQTSCRPTALPIHIFRMNAMRDL